VKYYRNHLRAGLRYNSGQLWVTGGARFASTGVHGVILHAFPVD